MRDKKFILLFGLALIAAGISKNNLSSATEPIIIKTIYEEGYHVMAADEEDIIRLTNRGLRVEREPEELATLQSQSELTLEIQANGSGIPNYPCIRTVVETNKSAQDLVDKYPNLAELIDVGDSWEKTSGLGGHDMMVLKLTNKAVMLSKPKILVTASIHANEYTPAELVMRFADYLLNNYGEDADVTWLLDYHEIHLMPQANPDGRIIAEAGYTQRKNTNDTNGGSCPFPPINSRGYGTDLNRNFDFKWNFCPGCSSGDPCSFNYRGPSAASEPEIQAIQKYVHSLFPDQRGPNDNDAAPDNATGLYFDIHSFGQDVMWPWGFTDLETGNASQLQTLGRKLAYFNDYRPLQISDRYSGDGSSADYVYGQLGVASYGFELGTEAFEECPIFENTIVPDNLPSLIYAAKVAGAPYITPAGPDANNLTLSFGYDSPGLSAGYTITLTAEIDDSRYNNSEGFEPTQNVMAAEFYIDVPPIAGGGSSQPVAMDPADGAFDSTVEKVQATIDLSDLTKGRRTIFVRGQDTDGNWGAISAIFLHVGGISPVEEGISFLPLIDNANHADSP